MDATIRGRDGDVANKEKIRTTATKKEGARVTDNKQQSNKMETLAATVTATENG